MKKYLLSFGAIVLAIGFSAFSLPAKKSLVDPVIFKYLAPGGSYSEANVESTALTSWEDISSLSCNQTNTKACSITVPLSETVDGAGQELDASKVTITAAGSGSTFRVFSIAVSSGSASFKNKSN